MHYWLMIQLARISCVPKRQLRASAWNSIITGYYLNSQIFATTTAIDRIGSHLILDNNNNKTLNTHSSDTDSWWALPFGAYTFDGMTRRLPVVVFRVQFQDQGKWLHI